MHQQYLFIMKQRKENVLSTSIDNNEMNQKLLELYDFHWDGYINGIRNNPELSDYKIANPYLVCASEQYFKARVKVMYIGQETNCWGGEFEDEIAGVEPLMKLYKYFVDIEKNYNSPFWNMYRKLEKETSEDVGFIANNIVKIGRKEGVGSDKPVVEKIYVHFNIIKKEIEILKPTIIIAMTGAYDNFIKRFLDGEIVNDISSEGFSKINFGKVNYTADMPLTYRFAHPGPIQRRGMYHQAIACIKNIISLEKS